MISDENSRTKVLIQNRRFTDPSVKNSNLYPWPAQFWTQAYRDDFPLITRVVIWSRDILSGDQYGRDGRPSDVQAATKVVAAI